MINIFRYFYRYSSLLYTIYQTITIYEKKDLNDIILIDKLIRKIKSCGSVAIKFCQWTLPKLEIMHIKKGNVKPLWFNKLENFYENCDTHDIKYTLNKYKESFQSDLINDYDILDILGSGSIGQVYLLQEKPMTKYTTPKKYVMKILHPKVKSEIYYFRLYYNLIKRLPYIKDFLKNNFPFEINGFIDNFEEQSNFINESNNLLSFQEYYRDNDYIIIPRLLRCSSDIIIMSYEDGISLDDLVCDKYNKYKIALLLTSFISNNQRIINMIHGDLHKGNWKIKKQDNDYKIVIYDFGFTWKIPQSKQKTNQLVTELFEDTDEINLDIDKMIEIFKFLIIDGYKHTDIIKHFINNNIYNIRPWILDPHRIFNLTVKMCVQENMEIDPILIQSIIIIIQCEKIFSEYRILSTDENIITSKEVYRKKYLDYLSYYKSNNIFHDYSKSIIEKLNEKQTEINSIFDCSEMPESIKILALKN